MEPKAYLHKVQYHETDQMGVVHHSNYIRWFEEARTDFMEQIGAGYDRIEENGYLSPVVSISCDYKSVTKYGESVYIILKLLSFNGVKFSVAYQVVDADTKKLRAAGESTHCFIDREGKLISLKKENKDYYDKLLRVTGVETSIP